MIYYKSKTGEVFAYESEDEREQFGGADLVRMTPAEVETHLQPAMTEQQIREAEIAQDRAYLVSTDYIVTKIAEASALGQDTQPLLQQYANELEQRELARVRIRVNEGIA